MELVEQRVELQGTMHEQVSRQVISAEVACAQSRRCAAVG